ncbi:ribulokinase [Paenibacillus sp. R14(2021)]|uniref:ribulokinase n=1 Tax=Paenibacillus sp. R14(2021) TaxID=2859228 RepID=UPI001C6143A9|nr:ribulokinase [Paenibacillus sp. R14(2021)]
MKYSIGVDFGTLSGRALLIEVETGREVASAVKGYTHGIMDQFLPDGLTALETDWALQHPEDYLEVLKVTVPEVLRKSGVSPEDVIGVGIDFTSSTIIPVKADGTPLCFLDEFKSRPHSYAKLWKHHAAQEEANLLNERAEQLNETFLARYGGKISSEWLLPKAWQILNEDPEIYAAADSFLEATDWIVSQLIGKEMRNSCTAGYKAIWHKQDGYPSNAFLKSLDPRLENFVEEKLSAELYPVGTKAGEITAEAARMTGLREGTAVAVGNVDAHVAIPAVGITEPGKMLMVMGTSTCHILLGKEEKIVPGMCGVVEDGVMPGWMGYEAGQSCVGDHFAWFVGNCVSSEAQQEAARNGMDIQQFLTQKAQRLSVGESGLIALDWWNGNRSTLVDADLTGLFLGMTLQTKPEEMYRALLEATAYGTKIIIDAFNVSGVPVTELYAAGGIAEKNPLMMQIYADVCNMEIRIAASSQTPAYGSAMFGAVAAGKERGGYDTISEAAKAIGKVKAHYYKPIPENTAVYEELYAEYKRLYHYFGQGENDVMKRLKAIRKNALKYD